MEERADRRSGEQSNEVTTLPATSNGLFSRGHIAKTAAKARNSR